MTQEGVEIQQRDQNSTAEEGHNSTKNPLNIHPGSVFNEGVKITGDNSCGEHQHKLSPATIYAASIGMNCLR